jgi:hypothetical protein
LLRPPPPWPLLQLGPTTHPTVPGVRILALAAMAATLSAADAVRMGAARSAVTALKVGGAMRPAERPRPPERTRAAADMVAGLACAQARGRVDGWAREDEWECCFVRK